MVMINEMKTVYQLKLLILRFIMTIIQLESLMNRSQKYWEDLQYL